MLPLVRRLFEKFLLVLVVGVRGLAVRLLLFRVDLFWFRLLFLVSVLLFPVLILLLLVRFLLFCLLIPVLLLKLVLLQWLRWCYSFPICPELQRATVRRWVRRGSKVAVSYLAHCLSLASPYPLKVAMMEQKWRKHEVPISHLLDPSSASTYPAGWKGAEVYPSASPLLCLQSLFPSSTLPSFPTP